MRVRKTVSLGRAAEQLGITIREVIDRVDSNELEAVVTASGRLEVVEVDTEASAPASPQ
jgi:hypothetical protein